MLCADVSEEDTLERRTGAEVESTRRRSHTLTKYRCIIDIPDFPVSPIYEAVTGTRRNRGPRSSPDPDLIPESFSTPLLVP